MTQVVNTVEELREAVRSAKNCGLRVGYLITTGDLHAAHEVLIAALRVRAGFVVVSNMVGGPAAMLPTTTPNPTTEDDAIVVGRGGADVLFAPSPVEIYPYGHDKNTLVETPSLSRVLCGEMRPGVYQGVATTVLKFFNIVQPDVAVFGEKDYQQFAVVRRMVRDLSIPIELVSVPTVRYPSGLAYASRNKALSAEEWDIAHHLYLAMDGVRQGLLAGGAVDDLTARGMDYMRAAGLGADYLEVRDEQTLGAPGAGPMRVFGSAYLGAVRLVDTLKVNTLADGSRLF